MIFVIACDSKDLRFQAKNLATSICVADLRNI
jgi:hypothetical protein